MRCVGLLDVLFDDALHDGPISCGLPFGWATKVRTDESENEIRFDPFGKPRRRLSVHPRFSPKMIVAEASRIDLDALVERYTAVRSFTRTLTAPLAAEDHVIQSMEDVSPTKWHLAHTTWFFETFVLGAFQSDYQPFHAEYAYLFNSYYVQAGARFSRPHRGLLSRPTVADVLAYRDAVDDRMRHFLLAVPEESAVDVAAVVGLGLNHEQQHQELILTDIKHVLSRNPLNPAYTSRTLEPAAARPMRLLEIEPGVYEVGHAGHGFAFDNEGPKHRVFIEPVAIGDRLVTNEEYAAFVADGGYTRPELWLSEGWARVESEGWRHPIYWEPIDEGWDQFTLFGLEGLRPEEPVCHISYFEADAYARWAGGRLPTEFEWEVASQSEVIEGNFVESRRFHPSPSGNDRQFFGDVWEWTGSAYAAYPGYRPAAGALGEYNGKFMCNQYVLRGGSCATSETHIRRTYRNFFHTAARWQFAGLRLAFDNGEVRHGS